MKLAIHYPNFSYPGGNTTIAPLLAATARAADEGGATTFTLMDHWFQMEAMAPATEPMLEGYTGLGFLAGITRKVRLGLLVTGVTYRHPGLLAKTVATLDVLSGGRAMFGIGAAWYEKEHRALGVPFPPVAERFERLEETLRITRQMFSDDDGPYEGTHYSLAETICQPKPIQQPGPPVMIGGSGEKKTLRLVAQYGDACNLFAPDVETVAHKIDVLSRHCADVGRDPAQIEKTIITSLDPIRDTDGFLRAMEEYAKVGVEQVWLSPKGTDDPSTWTLEVTERVLPRLRDI
ncbi:LLM class F420-dependent oxidoreductase [Cryptosporangium aurantiacum]|uniref:Probable F420-dependent oxidoreductase, Rv1855c family n=1 Tax=Cryptosporangium aurantiacum TaxID=134849 RepID=A0A1M7R8W5_9ACTN|nr:LLM class F420-dependent oxidoreductase [Cryptosporangium aurantiacum]SHN42549.1 probable F420-dependent oxidoreductase, Rv1855c family [Cryptosporangium aurantiacum]